MGCIMTKAKKIIRKKSAKRANKTKSSGIKTTTLFMNGQSQAVRIPKEFRMHGKEVYIKKCGDYIILIPKKDLWILFCESLYEFSDDFMKDGRELLPDQERDWSDLK